MGESDSTHNAVPIDLTAIVVAATGEQPRVLTIQDSEATAYPFGSVSSTLEGDDIATVERVSDR